MSNLPISIPLTGFPASWAIPGTYLEIDFAQGPSSGANVIYGALLIGNKQSSASAVVDDVVYGPYGTSPLPLVTEADAIALFGQGYELHRMWKRFVKKNPTTPVFAIAVTESSGAQATQAITFATTATANGNVRVHVCDDYVDVAITVDDSPTTVATNVKNAILGKPDWAVTASNSSGVLTITAKQKGLRGNWLSACAIITGAGVGTTSTVTAQAFLTGGTTADSNTNALATILAQRYYYLVSAAEDATQLGALSTQVNTQALATNGIRQTIVAASVDTEGNAQTIAIALNQARAEYPWAPNSPRPPCEIAADLCALYALGEQPDGLGAPSLHNFDGLGTGNRQIDGLWDMPPAFDGSTPSPTTINGALNNGLSPIAKNAFGQTYLVMRATTRSLTSGQADYRIRDPHKVRILDFYGDSLQSRIALQFGGKDIIDNPIPNQVFKSNNVVWPDTMRATVNMETQRWADDGQFQNVATMIQNTVCIREQSPRTRMSIRIPASPVDCLHQVGIQILQVA